MAANSNVLQFDFPGSYVGHDVQPGPYKRSKIDYNSTAVNPYASRKKISKSERKQASRSQYLHPSNTWGALYAPRGGPLTRGLFGTDWDAATDDQKRNRNYYGFTGRGKYTLGNFSRDARKMWKVARPFAGAAASMSGPEGMAAYEAADGMLGRGAYTGSFSGARAGGMIGRGGYSNAGYSAEGRGSLEIPELEYGPQTFEQSTMQYIDGRPIFGPRTKDDAAYNNLINSQGPDRVLSTLNDETNTIVLSHKEYIGDVVPTIAGGFQTIYFLALNPGLAGTFPWLANIAQFYEEYEFVQLIFFFKAMVTDGNSTAGGSIMMATQYNPTNPQFASKQTMENYEGAKSDMVTKSQYHGVECDPTKNGGTAIEYVRVGQISSGQDLKTFDLAVFQLSTNGTSTSSVTNLGELWVDYTVKLRKTKLPQLGGVSKLNIPYLSYSFSSVNGSQLISSSIWGASSSTNYSATTAPVMNPLPTSGVFGLPYSYSTVFTNYPNQFSVNSQGYLSSQLIFPQTVISGNYIAVITLNVSTPATSVITFDPTQSFGISGTPVMNVDTGTSDTVQIFTIAFTISNPGITSVQPSRLSLTAPNNIAFSSGSVLLTQTYSPN